MSKTPEERAREVLEKWGIYTDGELDEVAHAIREAIQATARRAAEIAKTVPWQLPEPNPVFTKQVGGRIAEKIKAEFGVDGQEG